MKFVFLREMTTYGKWPETGPGRKLGPILYVKKNDGGIRLIVRLRVKIDSRR